jgi:ApbE superfamily uncharacterized protein (UPF0280 family)
MPRLRRRSVHFDVPVQDMLLRIIGSEELYEEARAAGMLFWEQLQSYAVRHPGFQASKRPLQADDTAPPIVREMAEGAAVAGVGPMFTFPGAMCEFVGRRLAEQLPEITVSCEQSHYVVTRHRSRLGLNAQPPYDTLGVLIRPDLGPHGVHMKLGSGERGVPAEIIVVVARSCILADAAAAAAGAILRKFDGLKTALGYVKALPGVHGAVLIQGRSIGVTGALELAA